MERFSLLTTMKEVSPSCAYCPGLMPKRSPTTPLMGERIDLLLRASCFETALLLARTALICISSACSLSAAPTCSKYLYLFAWSVASFSSSCAVLTSARSSLLSKTTSTSPLLTESPSLTRTFVINPLTCGVIILYPGFVESLCLNGLCEISTLNLFCVNWEDEWAFGFALASCGDAHYSD